MRLVKFAHFEPVRQIARPQRPAWPAIREYLAARVTVEESSDHLENMWPSRIYPWRFPNQPYSFITAYGMVHVGYCHRHRRRHRNNLSSGLWYVNLSDLDLLVAVDVSWLGCPTALAAIADDCDHFDGTVA